MCPFTYFGFTLHPPVATHLPAPACPCFAAAGAFTGAAAAFYHVLFLLSYFGLSQHTCPLLHAHALWTQVLALALLYNRGLTVGNFQASAQCAMLSANAPESCSGCTQMTIVYSKRCTQAPAVRNGRSA
eukprot:1159437-Pelagomonas_calceolata.AAC.4